MKQVRREPFLMFCMVFTLVFAFAVGFTSYNFGALVRYKIPCLPTFGLVLAVVWSRKKDQKLARLKEREVANSLSEGDLQVE